MGALPSQTPRRGSADPACGVLPAGPAGTLTAVSAPAKPVEPTRGAPGLFGALYARFQRLIQEVGKFGIVGAICYGIDVTVFTVANAFTGWFWALVISTVISTTCAFTGNRFWTWRDRERTSLRREYLLYFGFNLVGLAIGIVVLFLSHNVLGGIWPALQSPVADLVSGKVLGVALASLFRFWAYRRFIFRPVAEPAA
jgi:putative flippase GtrA